MQYSDFITPTVRRTIDTLVSRAAKRGLNYQDCEDLRQDLIFGLIRKRDKYDAASGTWNTFARSVIRNLLSHCFEKRTTMKMSKVELLLDIEIDDNPQGDEDGIGGQPFVNTISAKGEDRDTLDLRLDVRSNLPLLPRNYRRVCRCLMSGIPPYKVHEHIGITEHEFKKIRKNLRRIFAEFAKGSEKSSPENRVSSGIKNMRGHVGPNVKKERTR